MKFGNRDALLQIATLQRRPKADGQLDHFPTRGLGEYIGCYEFYNVLWIERENEIAFRRALGSVFREAFESHSLEEIDVM